MRRKNLTQSQTANGREYQARMDAKRKDEPQTSCGFMQIKEGRWWKGEKLKDA
jgi:hypothetical protein